jgi:hypothetical protein
MSHESRPSAIRARYQSELARYSRLSFSKALHSAISLPHVCDHSIHRGLPVGEGTGGDNLTICMFDVLHPYVFTHGGPCGTSHAACDHQVGRILAACFVVPPLLLGPEPNFGVHGPVKLGRQWDCLQDWRGDGRRGDGGRWPRGNCGAHPLWLVGLYGLCVCGHEHLVRLHEVLMHQPVSKSGCLGRCFSG